MMDLSFSLSAIDSWSLERFHAYDPLLRNNNKNRKRSKRNSAAYGATRENQLKKSKDIRKAC